MGGVLLAEESAIKKVVSGCSHPQSMAGVLCGSRVVEPGSNAIRHRKSGLQMEPAVVRSRMELAEK
jgi:hypothetical protein